MSDQLSTGKRRGRKSDPEKTWRCYLLACVLIGEEVHTKEFLKQSKKPRDPFTPSGKKSREGGLEPIAGDLFMSVTAVAKQVDKAKDLNRQGAHQEFLDYMNERERKFLFFTLSLDQDRDKSVLYNVVDVVHGVPIRTCLTDSQFDAYVAAAQEGFNDGDYKVWRMHYGRRLRKLRKEWRQARLDYAGYLSRFDPERNRPEGEAGLDYADYLTRLDAQLEKLKITPMVYRNATKAEAEAMDDAREANGRRPARQLKAPTRTTVSRILPIEPAPKLGEPEDNPEDLERLLEFRKAVLGQPFKYVKLTEAETKARMSPFIAKNYPDHTGLPGCSCSLCNVP